MVAIRDLQVSMDIAKMKELGWFQQEFIVYGCSYWFNGERHYRVSNQFAEISRFRENSLLEGIFTSPTVEWLNRTLVPSGMQKEYMTETKKQLALRLQKLYPKSFFENFKRLAQTQSNDEAEPILRQLQRKLIGCFDRKTLEVMDGLIAQAYAQKKLTASSYQSFADWIADRLQQMADDMVIKKNTKRTFYGFGYQDGTGKIKFFCNAYEDEVFKRRDALMSQNKFCTPIISETYYYNQMPDMSKERAKFLAQLADWMDEEYWHVIELVHSAPSPIDGAAFQSLENSIDGYEEETQKALKELIFYYRTLWHVG